MPVSKVRTSQREREREKEEREIIIVYIFCVITDENKQWIDTLGSGINSK